MKTARFLALAAGIAAITGCTVNEAGNNTADAAMNADMNSADATLPPLDLNADMNADINVGTTNDVANDAATMNNGAANATNATE